MAGGSSYNHTANNENSAHKLKTLTCTHYYAYKVWFIFDLPAPLPLFITLQ
jgi:hypothetical protein